MAVGRRGAFVVWVVASLAASSPATAQPEVDAAREASAREYFAAGKRAYDRGQYPVAIAAFEEAYRLSPRPSVIYALAASHRQQWLIDGDVLKLARAVALFRDYVALPDAPKKDRAAEYLAVLEPALAAMAAKAGASAATEEPRPVEPPPAAPPPKPVAPVAKPAPAALRPAPRPPPAGRRGSWLLTAAAVSLGGAAACAVAARVQGDPPPDASVGNIAFPRGDGYDQAELLHGVLRVGTFGLLAAGVVAGTVGAILRFQPEDARARLGVSLEPWRQGGGVVVRGTF